MRFFPVRKENFRGGMAIFAGYLMAQDRWFDEIKESHYKSKKISAKSDFVDSSMIEEVQKLAGFKP